MAQSFELAAPFEPLGDQPAAIAGLTRWLLAGQPAATIRPIADCWCQSRAR